MHNLAPFLLYCLCHIIMHLKQEIKWVEGQGGINHINIPSARDNFDALNAQVGTTDLSNVKTLLY